MATAFADAIEPQQDLGGAISFPIAYGLEESGQTFLYGMPVMIASGDGGIQLWNGTVGAGGLIAGISAVPGNNLGSTGLGAPVGFSPILSFGSIIGNYLANSTQSAATISPPMVPLSDGFTYYFAATATTIFRARIGSSTGSTNPVVTAATQRGVSYGLTKDTITNFWFVDTAKTGASAVCTVVGFDPLDPIGTLGGHVLFNFNIPADIVALNQ